jgi:sigma-B regulation protein RsbU (phosphoserine phosphatase)
MAYLLVPEKKQTRKVPLRKQAFFIGRARENDLTLHSDSLSRFHAQINRKENGFLIYDRGSLNGVFINGQRIYGETGLKHGDIIGLGDVYVRFCDEDHELIKKEPSDKSDSSQNMQRFPFASLVDSRRFRPEKRERYLDLLYELSARLLQQSPSSDLGEVALEIVEDVWRPDRSCLMLEGEPGQWQIATQRFGRNPRLTGDNLQVSSSLIQEMEKKQEALLIVSRPEDERFAASDSLLRQNVNSVLCAPLWNSQKIHGFLYADILQPERSFNYGDLEMFSILANLVAMKWENDQYWHQALLQQQLEQELNLAADIQRKLFPSTYPQISGCDIGAMTIPSRKVGGDAYFWHQRKGGDLVLMIADVMGKGLPSALLMSQIQAILRIFSEQYGTARDIVTAVNEFIYHYSTQERFISMVVVILSSSTGKMTFCNAGHNPPFLLKEDNSVVLLEDGGMPVGVFPDQNYRQGEFQMGNHSMLVLYTDGLTEARDTADEEFGFDRLIEIARDSRQLSAGHLVQELIRKIREEWLATDQEDDWTLLILKRD